MSFSVPKRLVGSPKTREILRPANVEKAKQTVYTLRITTSPDRSATHSDTSSGVLVALVGETDDCLLRFIATSPEASDAASTEAMLREMCAGGAGDIPPGADCSLIMGSPTPTVSSYNRHRFLSGTTTEVSFVAPDLGPLSAVIVGPQSGTWGCSEVVVSSSADLGVTSSKFVSKERAGLLGEDVLHSASYLVRVPLGSIMYGEGQEARVLSASDAMEMSRKNMTWYEEMKKRLLFYTATVGFVGTGLAYGSLGPDAAAAFASGSAMSFAYQVGLQRKADGIGASSPSSSLSPSKELPSKESPRIGTAGDPRTALVTGALPVIGVGALAWFVYNHPDLLGMHRTGLDNGGNDTFSLLLALVAGFGSQKLALVLFSMGRWGGRDGDSLPGKALGGGKSLRGSEQGGRRGGGG